MKRDSISLVPTAAGPKFISHTLTQGPVLINYAALCSDNVAINQ